ncbi:MAG: Na+/H+ antiporter subunit G [Nitrosomonas sp.]|nr:Na+/H+ antiporter subunit G [Nitrosomonas sp.]
MLEYFLSFLILTGAIFTFIGSLGLLRLKDLFTRLHGPTKATTLGVGCLLIASAVYFSTYTEAISLHEILITLFLFITAPISAHLLAKAALHLDLQSIAKIPENDEVEESGTDAAIIDDIKDSVKESNPASINDTPVPLDETDLQKKP